MFKHNESAWVGVFTKLANAQDWWIKNDKTTGNINLQTVATGGVADIYIMKETTPDKVVAKYFTMAGNPVLVPQWALGWN
jgi:alpha-glucosidase (family GH31 glycosyl hydrolase)